MRSFFLNLFAAAQSILFAHENWLAPEVGLESQLATLAGRRNLKDLTIGPVLSVTTETFEAHRDALLQVLWAAAASFF